MDGNLGLISPICHLQCEISSVKITNLSCSSTVLGAIFLRCHVPAGGGTTIHINSYSNESCDSDDSVLWWHNVASLKCNGPTECVQEMLDRESVVFELWGRKGRTILGRIVPSELVGRAEVAWKDALEVGESAVERRFALVMQGGSRSVQVEAPMLSVSMTVNVLDTVVAKPRTGGQTVDRGERESGCEWSVNKDDVFGVVVFAADDALE